MISYSSARNKADEVNNFNMILNSISSHIEVASALGAYHIDYTQKDRNLLERLISYFERSQFEVSLISSSTLRIYWG